MCRRFACLLPAIGNKRHLGSGNYYRCFVWSVQRPNLLMQCSLPEGLYNSRPWNRSDDWLHSSRSPVLQTIKRLPATGRGVWLKEVNELFSRSGLYRIKIALSVDFRHFHQKKGPRRSGVALIIPLTIKPYPMFHKNRSFIYWCKIRKPLSGVFTGLIPVLVQRCLYFCPTPCAAYVPAPSARDFSSLYKMIIFHLPSIRSIA